MQCSSTSRLCVCRRPLRAPCRRLGCLGRLGRCPGCRFGSSSQMHLFFPKIVCWSEPDAARRQNTGIQPPLASHLRDAPSDLSTRARPLSPRSASSASPALARRGWHWSHMRRRDLSSLTHACRTKRKGSQGTDKCTRGQVFPRSARTHPLNLRGRHPTHLGALRRLHHRGVQLALQGGRRPVVPLGLHKRRPRHRPRRAQRVILAAALLQRTRGRVRGAAAVSQQLRRQGLLARPRPRWDGSLHVAVRAWWRRAAARHHGMGVSLCRAQRSTAIWPRTRQCGVRSFEPPISPRRPALHSVGACVFPRYMCHSPDKRQHCRVA